MRKTTIHVEKALRAHELQKEGMTMREIADVLGVHHEQVNRWLKKDYKYLTSLLQT